MSAARPSASRLGRVREVMNGYVERGEVPGVVVLVSRRGATQVYAVGQRSFGSAEPMRRDTIFRISSMTKPVTAVATMILVEECKLRLDEPVDRLLPELAERKVLKRVDGPLDDTEPANRPITVRDLLTFRMGFGVLMAPPDTFPIQKAVAELRLGQGPPAPSIPPPPDEWMRRLGTLPLMYQPGERWMYNTGSDVLGVLIARAAGQPLEVFMRERIFDPLGMNDTGFSVPPTDIGRLVTTSRTNPFTGSFEVYDEAEGGQWSRPPAFPSGSGGLVSTAEDYFAFGQMLLDKGAYRDGRILSRSSVEVMTADHLTPAQKSHGGLVPGFFENHGWGFGVSVVTRRDEVAKSVGTFGWDGGLGTTWSSDPREEMVTILMSPIAWRSPDPPNICLDFWTSAYQAIDD